MPALSLIAFAMLINLTACTGNVRAKRFGGTMTVELPANQKLVNATWKDSQLWYLSKPMSKTDTAVTYTFKEKSNYGIREGSVIFVETKK